MTSTRAYLPNFISKLHQILHVTVAYGSVFSGGVVIRYVLPVLIDDVMFAQSANVTLRHNVAFPVVFAARSFCTTSLHLPCERHAV